MCSIVLTSIDTVTPKIYTCLNYDEYTKIATPKNPVNQRTHVPILYEMKECYTTTRHLSEEQMKMN